MTPMPSTSSLKIPRWMTVVQAIFALLEVTALIVVGVHVVNNRHDIVTALAFIVLVLAILVQTVMGIQGVLLIRRHNAVLSDVVREKTQCENSLIASEKSLRALVDNSQVAFSLINPDYRLLAWNPLSEQHAVALGTSKPSKGASVLEATPVDNREQYKTIFQHVLQGNPMRGVHSFQDANSGEMRDFAWRMNPVYDDRGEHVIAVVSMTEDVTTVKQLEQSARDAETLYGEIAEHIGLTIWVRDLRAKKLLYISPAYEKMFEDKRESALQDADSYQQMIHPEDRAAHAERVRRADAGEEYNAEYRIVLPDGQIKWIWAHSSMIRDEDGKPVRTIGLAQDISAIRQAQRDALDLAVERERRRLLATFIRNISHEFRTPLATIHSGLYLLGKTKDEAERATRIQRIEEQADNILTLVEAMVELTRIESEIDLYTEVVALTPFLESCVLPLTSEAAARSIRFDCEIAPDLPRAKIASPQMRRALGNVLHNAFRYTPPDGAVKVCAEAVQDTLHITIADTGIGIDPVDHKRIFEPFFRVDEARNTTGFGLGLAVAQRIIELHNGTITVESALGEGSTFTICIPIRTA